MAYNLLVYLKCKKISSLIFVSGRSVGGQDKREAVSQGAWNSVKRNKRTPTFCWGFQQR